jgi:hypothetical protein
MVNFMEIIIVCKASGEDHSSILFFTVKPKLLLKGMIYLLCFLKEINLIYGRFKSCVLFETPYIYSLKNVLCIGNIVFVDPWFLTGVLRITVVHVSPEYNTFKL